MNRWATWPALYLAMATLARWMPPAEAGDDTINIPFVGSISPSRDLKMKLKGEQVELAFPPATGDGFRVDITKNPLFRDYLKRATEDTRKLLADGCTIAGVPYRLDFDGGGGVEIKSAAFLLNDRSPPPGRVRIVFDVRYRTVVASEFSLLGVTLEASAVVHRREERVVLHELGSRGSKVLVAACPSPRFLGLPGDGIEAWADVKARRADGR